MIAAFLLLLASEAALPPGTPPGLTEPTPQTMTPDERRAFNALVPPDHPWRIRCKRYEAPGSIVKKVNSCRTIGQWRQAEDNGNQDARDIMDKMRSKSAGQVGG